MAIEAPALHRSQRTRPKAVDKPAGQRRGKREPAKALRLRVLETIRRLREAYPDAHCALVHDSPFQLLVATILSAQCTDKRVNMTTPELFARYPTPQDLATAPAEEVEELIKPTGFFRNKTKSIQGAARMLESDFHSRVPDTMAELLRLPGVARKTANVLLGVAYGKNEGVVVDTHVGRIARRLAFTRQTDPVKVEQDLMTLVPREEWTDFSHLLIFHGRACCTAIKPACGRCPLLDLCPAAFKA